MLFRITPLGQELFNVHRGLHQQMDAGLVQFLQRYEAHELRLIVRMLQDMLVTPRVNLEFRPDLTDAAADS